MTFGSLLTDVGILLAPFGSFRLPLASLWLPLASLWQALHSLGVRFASCLSFEIFGFAFSDFLCYGGGLHVSHLCTNSAKNKLRYLYTVFGARGAAGCRASDVDPAALALSGAPGRAEGFG